MRADLRAFDFHIFRRGQSLRSNVMVSVFGAGGNVWDHFNEVKSLQPVQCVLFRETWHRIRSPLAS